jgi:hypothetical protein
MAETPVDEIVAVVGETVGLRFESEEAFAGNALVTFIVSKLDPTNPGIAPVPSNSFSKQLATKALRDNPASSLPKQSSADWVVDLGTPSLRGALVSITFAVTGRGAATGKEIAGRAINRLRVPGIVVTSDSHLQSIMLHEFFRPSGSDYVFDSAPVQAIADGLTVAQRKLLATYDIGSRSDRLVAFITLKPSPRRFMWADFCQQDKYPTSVHANATFTVFHSKGKGELVTVLCHTDCMLVDTVNPDTRELLSNPKVVLGKSLPPDKWLSENNELPPKFLVGSHAAHFTDSVVWSRIFASDGTDVMPGNSMHGIINTAGCWMLFRNHNWPITQRAKFFDDYVRILRPLPELPDMWKKLEAALATAGYDGESVFDDAHRMTVAGSVKKFLYCDLNYAYNFFFKYVVGIDFFSTESTWYGRFANLYQTHGMTFSKTFPMSKVPDGHLYHDVDAARKINRSFQPGPAQWIENAAGFQTAQNFLPDSTWKQNITPAQMTSMTWADVYLYKPDAVSMNAALASPVSTSIP